MLGRVRLLGSGRGGRVGTGAIGAAETVWMLGTGRNDVGNQHLFQVWAALTCFTMGVFIQVSGECAVPGLIWALGLVVEGWVHRAGLGLGLGRVSSGLGLV